MCQGTFTTFYSCGHVVSTADVCLQDVDPHYRCEPRGMKITQPNGRCVECYARGLSPAQQLTTTIRFTPAVQESSVRRIVTPPSSFPSEGRDERCEAILRWVMDVPAFGPGTLHLEKEGSATSSCSLREDALSQQSSVRHEQAAPRPANSHRTRHADEAAGAGYEADDDEDEYEAYG